MHVQKGELIAIVGEIGSGKSALLQSVIGELLCLEGRWQMDGRIRYVSQTPWIIDSTLHNNIRLSRILASDDKLYEKVFKDCELEADIKPFLEGDKIEIGARGVNLSGGQRARVGIARELYAGGDIFLFDDCFSALDPQVADKIFKKIILSELQNQTRIVVTHAFHLASLAPRIIVLKQGKIVEEGSYSELISKNGEFVRLQSGSSSASLSVSNVEKAKDEKTVKVKEVISAKAQEEAVTSRKLETKAVGGINWRYYLKLIQLGGNLNFLLSVIVFFLAEIMMVLIQWWLAMWTENYFSGTMWFYTAIYSTFAILFCIFLLCRKYMLAYFQYQLSLMSQLQLVEVLLHTPITWFDFTPIGRIVNRAVKDQSIVDYLGIGLASAVQKCVSLIVSIAVIGIITPYFFLLMIVLLGFYLFWYITSIQAARDARRLVSINHSPMYGLFNEILDGLINIRQSNLEEVFLDRQHSILDTSARSFLFKAYCSRWINLRISLLGVFAVIGSCIFLSYNDSIVLGALAGYSLLNSISIASKLGSMLLTFTDVETSMASMERICEYIEGNPQEKSYDEKRPSSPTWPGQGKIVIQNLSVKYQPQLTPALKDISLVIPSGQKIGVVGRTGSGKSSFTLAILRLLEPLDEGDQPHITIDDENIELIGLRYLRQNIGIIPQDPILFSGTIRSNLDLFDKFQDEEIIQAISKVNMLSVLKRKVEEMESNEMTKEGYVQIPTEEKKITDEQVMNYKVGERGDNFSIGERQLLCIARALIKSPKILIMDEATASVDEATDHNVQEMVRSEFKNATVIIIAHRVKTILECNKIVVLDNGRLIEYDTPTNMIQRKTGFLYDSLQKSEVKN